MAKLPQLFPVWHRLGGHVVLAALLALAVSCAGRDDGPVIDLSARLQPALPSPIRQPPKDRLILAVAAVNSPMSTFGSYADLARYLAERLGLEAKFISGKTYAEINSLVRSGDATVAIVCSGAYVYGTEETHSLELLAAPIIRGESTYYAYLIVHQDSPITGWDQLQGRTFAFTDPLSNSGRLVPLYQVWQLGRTPESLFSKYIFTYSHDSSIKAVAGKLVDAAAVDSLVYDYALARGEDEAARTKIIWRSPPYGINPVVVNPNLDPLLKGRMRALLLEMHTSEEGQRILNGLGFDRFVPISDTAYTSVREMARLVGFQRSP